TPLLEIEPKEWNLVLDVNLTGAWNVLSAVARQFAARGGGAFVAVSSIDGARPVAGLAHHFPSKARLQSPLPLPAPALRPVRRCARARPGRRPRERGRSGCRGDAADGPGARTLGRTRRLPRAHPARADRRPARDRICRGVPALGRCALHHRSYARRRRWDEPPR